MTSTWKKQHVGTAPTPAQPLEPPSPGATPRQERLPGLTPAAVDESVELRRSSVPGGHARYRVRWEAPGEVGAAGEGGPRGFWF